MAAALFYYWIKTNQTGKSDQVTVHTQMPVSLQMPFERTGTIIYSKHALCRMACRHIDESEVKEILLQGKINYDKIEESDKGRTYPLEGNTHDNQNVRIVFAPHDRELIVVTVVDLDKEWPCDCD